MSQQQTKMQRIMDYTPFIILGMLIFSVLFAWVFYLNPYLDSLSEKSHLRYESREAEEKQIKSDIENDLITCEYISEQRMKYAGDPFINAIDDSFIKSKLMTYWNTHNCGVEWEWWE